MTNETLENIAANTGISPTEMSRLDWDEIDRRIEKRIGKKLVYDKCEDQRFISRGSVFLMLGRMIDPVNIAKRFAGIK